MPSGSIAPCPLAAIICRRCEIRKSRGLSQAKGRSSVREAVNNVYGGGLENDWNRSFCWIRPTSVSFSRDGMKTLCFMRAGVFRVCR